MRLVFLRRSFWRFWLSLSSGTRATTRPSRSSRWCLAALLLLLGGVWSGLWGWAEVLVHRGVIGFPRRLDLVALERGSRLFPLDHFIREAPTVYVARVLFAMPPSVALRLANEELADDPHAPELLTIKAYACERLPKC